MRRSLFDREATVDIADFLFPTALQKRDVHFKKIIFIGSCLAEQYIANGVEILPSTEIDIVLFNNASDLPERSVAELGEYDFQFIQLPLRSILTDAVVRVFERLDGESAIDFLELGKQNIDVFLEKALEYNTKAGLLTLVANFIIPEVHVIASLSEFDTAKDLTAVIRELNGYLSRKAAERRNVFIADVESIAASLGKSHFFDDSIYFYSHGAVINPVWSSLERFQPWSAPEPGRIEPVPDLDKTYEIRSKDFYRAVFRQMEAIYRTFHQIDMVKIVIFDLDNTMWRGLLGEQYVGNASRPPLDNWPTGVWEAIQHLRRRGIVVSIASKNDESAVRERWTEAVPLPFVRFDDFILPQINWSPKAENIAKVLDMLSLTPASAVFVDDNPVERESVAAQLPGIRVIGSDPFATRRILLWAPETQVAYRTAETARREEMLKHQVTRKTEQLTISREEFLANLGATLTFWEVAGVNDRQFARIFELTNKTNQFNTNGNRWSVEQFLAHFAEGGRVFAFSVVDRYTEYGLVGVVFTAGSDIVQYLMSCRVLGMEIETAVVGEVVRRIRSANGDVVVRGTIVETPANNPCRDLYQKSGFSVLGANIFELASNAQVKLISHIEIIDSNLRPIVNYP